jgi:hypothetical protein
MAHEVPKLSIPELPPATQRVVDMILADIEQCDQEIAKAKERMEANQKAIDSNETPPAGRGSAFIRDLKIELLVDGALTEEWERKRADLRAKYRKAVFGSNDSEH